MLLVVEGGEAPVVVLVGEAYRTRPGPFCGENVVSKLLILIGAVHTNCAIIGLPIYLQNALTGNE